MIRDVEFHSLVAFLSSPGICHELNNVFAACMQMKRCVCFSGHEEMVCRVIRPSASIGEKAQSFFCLFVVLGRRLARDMPLVKIEIVGQLSYLSRHMLATVLKLRPFQFLPGLGAKRGFRSCSLWCIHDVDTNTYGTVFLGAVPGP